MKIHSIEQGTPEWFNVRKLKLTASHGTEIATAGKGLETYTNKLISESFSSAGQEIYTNADMERGNQLENEARTIYSLETGVEIKQVGFIEHDEHIGCSPDGLINEDGGIEIKCPSDKVYTDLLLSKKIDTKYMWQIQMCMLITSAKWWDFIAYNPNFKKQMYIERIKPDAEKYSKLLKGLELGKEMLKEKIKIMQEMEKINV